MKTLKVIFGLAIAFGFIFREEIAFILWLILGVIGFFSCLTLLITLGRYCHAAI